MAVEDWIKMGYSEEDAKELAECEKTTDIMNDTSIDEMVESLQTVMEQFK